MNTKKDANHEQMESRNKKLAIAAACIAFLIGWYHTGQGLEGYKILGGWYGGYVIATMILIMMIIAYSTAVYGAGKGLLIYCILALITFACNLNSFYPNYRADALIRDELRQHRNGLGELREWVSTKFLDPEAEELKATVANLRKQLVEQCNQGGTGPGTNEILRRLEAALGREITRIRYTADEAQMCGERYGQIIDEALNAKLVEDKYLDKEKITRYSAEVYDIYDPKIETSLKDKTAFVKVPSYVEQLVEDRNSICNSIEEISKREPQQPVEDSDEPEREPCDVMAVSANKDINTFSHTFRSIWETLSDGGTLFILIIAFMVDFVVPVFIYILAVGGFKKRQQIGWIAGGRRVQKGPEIDN